MVTGIEFCLVWTENDDHVEFYFQKETEKLSTHPISFDEIPNNFKQKHKL